jgi:very-short-patch-repair endonuclease
MAMRRSQSASRAVWRLAASQHGVVSRAQLLAAGLNGPAIHRRLENGRLHRIHRGVYAVGRPQVDRYGRWLAAVLACGQQAALSHRSAAALWGLIEGDPEPVEISVPLHAHRKRPGLLIHRRSNLGNASLTRRAGIPVTSAPRTLVDLATQLSIRQLEAAVNEADRLDLISPDRLKAVLAKERGAAGGPKLRELLDSRIFALTDSELERRFLRLVRRANLTKPLTGAFVGDYRTDFYWPGLGLVVETDGLRYHRTPTQQAKDRQRDQAYVLAGLTPLRFTHAQVVREPDRVVSTLRAVVSRLSARNS